MSYVPLNNIFLPFSELKELPPLCNAKYSGMIFSRDNIERDLRKSQNHNTYV